MSPKIEQIKETTKLTVDEISKAAKAHVELAKNQYTEYKTRHGDPVDRLGKAVREPVEKTRTRVVEVGKKAEKRAGDLAHKVNERTEALTKKVTDALPSKKNGHEAGAPSDGGSDASKSPPAQKSGGARATSPKVDKPGPSNPKV